jgi:glycine C-acetyltransferase
MVKDLFERISKRTFRKWGQAEDILFFPKLEGELGPRMQFDGKKF